MAQKPKDESKAIGGIARRDALTPEKRKEIAAKAAIARWGERPLSASHKGNFKEKFGVDVDCYVLDDAEKSAVISQTGMAKALGLASRASSFPKFINSQAMAVAGSAEMRNKVENPIKFQWGSGGTEAPPSTVHGFESGFLIDICNAIIEAEASGKLKGARYENVIRQAHIIVGASAKSGIRQLVYALAGYNPTVEEVIAAFKAYVLEEAKKYEPEFPPELYMHWHRLYEIPVPVRGKPWHFKHLTVRHIYYPLAKSSGKLLALLRAIKASQGDRQKKLFQFLNDVGARALRMHLGRVLEMAESSPDKATYEKKINDRFGDQPELDLVMPDQPSPNA
jgi:hypothetical protein